MTETKSICNQWPDSERHLARLVDEFSKRLEAGKPVDVQSFATAHPEHADQLRRLLPAIQSLAELGCSIAESARASAAAVAEHTSPAPGVLGDFRIIREIGRGGMGVVYEAEQISMQRRVALKVLPFAAVMDDKQIRRFKNEALAAGQLQHTNIVPVYSVGCERGVHFYAMQFIDGQTLGEVIRELRRAASPVKSEDRGLKKEDRETAAADDGLPPSSTASTSPFAALSTNHSTNPKEYFRSVARLGVQAAEALEHAHESGVIHRDIKPSNLLLDKKGNLWITDFGLAHIFSPSPHGGEGRGEGTNLTMTGDLIGTLRYMSPEQALAKRVIVDHRTDIYSLGVTLYELLTLQPAFASEDRHELLRQIAFDEPRPPRRINDRIPPELETIVLKATAKNPTERYASARELAEDLDRLLRDEPIKARRPTLVQRARKWTRRHKPVVWSAAACALMALVALAGSIGWFAGDRAARWAAVERQVDVALHEATQLMQQAKWPEARAWLERADGLLAGGGSRVEVRQRVVALRNDLDLVQGLEHVRLERAAVLDGGMTYADVDSRYAKVFLDYGIKFDELGADEAAERIRHSAVCSELTAMIDDWAIVRRARASDTWNHLLEIARLADRDPLRNRLRDGLERSDRAALEEVATFDAAADFPPVTAVLLADVLGNLGSNDQAISLLRHAQRRHPADLWLNARLAARLHDLKPPQWDEVIRFFTAALAVRPDDAALHNDLGDAFRHKGAFEEATAALQLAQALNSKLGAPHNNLGLVYLHQRRLDAAINEFRKAIDLEPDFFGAHDNLGATLLDIGELQDGIDEIRKAIRLRQNDPTSHFNLGNALSKRGELAGAIDEYHKAIELNPTYAEAYCNLGNCLRGKGDLHAAIAACCTATELKPGLANAHNSLGALLADQGELDAAIDEIRKAIELGPDEADVHCNLGGMLWLKRELDAAAGELRKEIELNPHHAHAHNVLGLVLIDKGDLDAAIRSLTMAINLEPEYAEAHFNLANALAQTGDLDAAIDENRRAIKLKSDFAEAHVNLGAGLQQKGQFREALTELRRGHELGSRNPNWPYQTATLVAEAERLVELDSKLPAILSGDANPSGAAEQIEFAWLCLYYKHQNAAAARFYAQAFAAQPELATDITKQHRYNAACAAALAGCGQGHDAESIGDEERARLRQQALDWLRADLESWRKLLEGNSADARAKVVGTLKHWQTDSDLAGVRDAEELAKLPDAEREGWGRLWAEVAELVGNAGGRKSVIGNQ